MIEAQLRDIIREQQRVLLMLERTVREHHRDFGEAPGQCADCAFWFEAIKQLRRRVRRAGV